MSVDPKTPNKPKLGNLGNLANRLPDAQTAQTPFRGLGFGQGDAHTNRAYAKEPKK